MFDFFSTVREGVVTILEHARQIPEIVKELRDVYNEIRELRREVQDVWGVVKEIRDNTPPASPGENL